MAAGDPGRGRRADDDPDVHVIVLQGAGDAFCAGYDLKLYAEEGDGFQPPVWDPIKDYRLMKRNTDDFFTPLALTEADHRQGARARGGGRQRHRAVAATWW